MPASDAATAAAELSVGSPSGGTGEDQDRDALTMFVDPTKACDLLDGVPGVKTVNLGSTVGELEGTTQREARATWAKREGITWWSDLPESAD